MLRSIVYIILWLTVAKALEVSVQKNRITNSSNDVNISDQWINIDKNLKGMVKSAIKFAMPIVMETAWKMNLTSTCKNQAIQLFVGLKRLDVWAIKFIDSSGKMIDGMLSGTISAFGNYDECLNIVASKKKDGRINSTLFRGKYCIIHVKSKMPPAAQFSKNERGMQEQSHFIKSLSGLTEYFHSNAELLSLKPLSVGVCVPSGCTLDDINQVTPFLENFATTAEVERCETRERQGVPFDTAFYVAIAFYSVAATLVFLGTVLELLSKKYKVKIENFGLKLLLTFSIKRNFKKLINMEKSNDTLSCLHGLRFLSVAWIVVSHTMLFPQNFVEIHADMTNLFDFAPRISAQIISNGFLAVDSFFLIGGFLLSYLTLKDTEGVRKKKGVVFPIIHRIWRIIPLYIFTILAVFLTQNTGSGPVYQQYSQAERTKCKENWWLNILFVNNFFNPVDDLCLVHSWYLACDFQLFIAGIIIMQLFRNYPKIGIAAILSLISAFAVGIGIWTWIYEIPPTFIYYDISYEKMLRYSSVYSKPFVHAGPYLWGMLLGYIIAKKRDLKFSKKVKFLGWTGSIALACLPLFGTYVWNAGKEPIVFESVSYASLSKLSFAISIAWVIMSCSFGFGGLVNSILSWSAWVPLSRLSFGIYLTSPIVQILYLASSKTLLEYETLPLVWQSLGSLFFSLVTALVLSLLVEAPFISLEKILFFRKSAESCNRSEVNKNGFVNGGYDMEANIGKRTDSVN